MYEKLILRRIKEFKKSQDYYQMSEVEKKIVSYLMFQVVEIVQKKLLSVRKCEHKNIIISIFELNFTFSSLTVYTIHKGGATNTKVFECIKLQRDSIIKAIESFCQYVGWEIEGEKNRVINRKTEKLNILWNVQEEEAP